MAKNRSIKVVSQSGYNYKATPTITLKGQWLKELGRVIFEFNSYLIDNVIQCSTIEVQTNKGGA